MSRNFPGASKVFAGAALTLLAALLWRMSRRPQPLDDASRAWAVRTVRELVAGRDAAEAAPTALARRRRGVAAVTLYGRQGASARAVAEGDDRGAAIRSAALALRRAGRLGDPLRVQVELSYRGLSRLPRRAIQDTVWNTAPLGEVGVYAASGGDAPRWDRWYFPSAWTQSVWAADNRALDQLVAGQAGAEGDAPPVDAGALGLWTFEADGFVEAADRGSTLLLRAGRAARGGWTRRDLIDGAEGAGRWLVRSQLPTGRYHYVYDALADEFDDARYNLPRHCGTTYALFQLHLARPDPKLLDAGRRGLGYLEARLGPGSSPGSRFLRDEAGRGTLGSSALALVAWSERLRAGKASPSELATAGALAAWLVERQRPDGSFQVAIGPGTDPEAPDEESYYPGEALFALLRLYGVTKDERWLRAARHGAFYRMGRQKRKAPAYDAWFIHALGELNSLEPSERLVEHGALVARRMVETLRTDASGRYAPVSLGALCSRVEGVVSAARMARASGRGVPADLEAFLRSAAADILHAQYTPDNAYYLPNPDRARGAFMGTTSSHKARVDVIHHCLSAYLGLSEVLF